MSVLVDYCQVRFWPPSAVRPALDGVDLAAGSGDVVLVVGHSAAGKSTLLRAANGLVPHASGGRFSGDVRIAGRSVRTHRPRDFADLVGFVHQDPEAQSVVDHVAADVAYVLENLGTDGTALRRRVEEVLDALGIAHLRDRSPATLSGGERQRMAIAGAMASGPSLLVLDEPTSQLDPQGADDVLAAVNRLNQDLGTTVLLAEHRLERAAPLAHRAVVLADGHIVAEGDPADVLAGYDGGPPVVDLGRLLGWSPPPLTVRDARARARSVELPVVAVHPGPVPGPVLIRARGLAVAGRLAPTDLDLRAGEVVAVLGRNGAGKTTLLTAFAGLVDGVVRGKVERVDGAAIAYVPQHPTSLLGRSTVRDELVHTLELLGGRHRRDRRRFADGGAVEAVDAWLDRLGLSSVAHRHPRSLSGGERQRVAVAAVAVGGAPVLLLDEPTRGMDSASRAALERAVRDHTARGGAVMVATHDVELAARLASTVVVLAEGEIVANGPARSVLAGSLFAPQVLRVFPPYLTVAEVGKALGAAS